MGPMPSGASSATAATSLATGQFGDPTEQRTDGPVDDGQTEDEDECACEG